MTRDLSKELSLNTDLVEACGKLGLLSLLEAPEENCVTKG